MRRRDQKVIAAVLLVLLAGIESIGGGAQGMSSYAAEPETNVSVSSMPVAGDEPADRTVHIALQEADRADYDKIKQKADCADLQMRTIGFDEHNDKIGPAGGGVLQIDEGISDPHQRAACDGGKKAAAGVDRQKRGEIVDHRGVCDHAQHRAQKETLPEAAVGQNGNGDVEEQERHADRDGKEHIQDVGKPGKADGRNVCGDGEVHETDRSNEAAGQRRQIRCSGAGNLVFHSNHLCYGSENGIRKRKKELLRSESIIAKALFFLVWVY